MAVDGTGLYPEVEVAVHEVSTAYGRCYTLYFDRLMRTDDEYYELVFNMSRHGKIRLYLHERHNEVKHIVGILVRYGKTNVLCSPRSACTTASGRCFP